MIRTPFFALSASAVLAAAIATVPASLMAQAPAADTSPQSAANTASADVLSLINEGREGVWACSSCHGADGAGSASVPRLAGLPEAYLARQLRDYRDGLRTNENMQFVAKHLSDAEIASLAAQYSRLASPSNAAATLGGDVERGRELAMYGDWKQDIPPCFSCHGSSAFGVAPHFPGLAAQPADYTYAQLAAWVQGRRSNSSLDLMEAIANRMSPADMKAVADYLATLAPAPVTSSTEQ
ncbi:c-type cytochrome [Indioceanicola profundi]|uniref:c-type cytochrome n=1 Tax=Indioceanicola profundi TaxID=2220096 RepID=UPI000E6ABE6B|nr:c-type cytochrome [Indioceanicola profundi]